MKPLRATRYFVAVSPPAAPLLAVFGILPAGAAVLEIVDRGSSDWVLASIALVQLFASSTGFTRHATRGYYDPVLLGERRARVALAHFAASASPGIFAWVACGVAQAAAARSLSVPAFSSAGWAALALVSSIPWAATVRSAPFLGGALWLLLSISLVVSGKVLGPLSRIHAYPAWAGENPATAFGLGLAFPFAIPSLQWPPEILLAFAAASAIALAAGVARVVRADFALAEEGG